MREVLLTYYHPEPHLWASPLGMPIMTKEHALQHAQEMVGKPIGVGMCLFTVKTYEIVPNEQDASYGRIFAHCSKSENAVPAVVGELPEARNEERSMKE
jgi:hypothetical protein